MENNNQFQDPNIVRLLWTSGWDSTFRLLQLVIEKKVTVLPIYVITDRASTMTEIKTMVKIKKLIHKLFPETVGRILPTIHFPVYDLNQYPEITKKNRDLKSLSKLGSQYDWLSRYAEQHGINDLELSIHADDKAYGFIKGFVVKQEGPQGEYYSLDPKIGDDNPLSLFKPFRYPILEWTKVKMKEHSLKIGTLEIMNLTWFCHSPKNGEPCGLCSPCKYSIQEGMRYRFPKKALLRYRLAPVYEGLIKVYVTARRLLHPQKLASH
jgi:hypothetical protein